MSTILAPNGVRFSRARTTARKTALLMAFAMLPRATALKTMATKAAVSHGPRAYVNASATHKTTKKALALARENCVDLRYIQQPMAMAKM